ncbi:hypothetical protein [Sulfobacillus harzensis]|uniref:Uncharacterized protein n=1 Tax=Sulfobacillus harzensis TaxID=2729629 RepID=A0A7Y0L820_9FIRM|nr:hypothetical protein [Sulfobacillus harzensis]NMP25028.1 hypothetical protein [Sulfobacillus harzensis]
MPAAHELTQHSMLHHVGLALVLMHGRSTSSLDYGSTRDGSSLNDSLVVIGGLTAWILSCGSLTEGYFHTQRFWLTWSVLGGI